MLVKELITWIVAPLTPAPAAGGGGGFTAEALAFSQHSRLITRHPFQSQPDWPATGEPCGTLLPPDNNSLLFAYATRQISPQATCRWEVAFSVRAAAHGGGLLQFIR